MNQFGNLYSQYYDLLYCDKDYLSEVEYVDSLIKKHAKNAKYILDLGCGTGKHAKLFLGKGYSVHGVDQSEEMLLLAKKRALKHRTIEQTSKNDGRKLTFTQSKITDLNLNQKFDVIVSLFHVMSYQNSNEALIKSFEIVKKHLKKDGLFIFDFWYGPAVLTELPTTRIKRLESDYIKITRIAEPKLDAQANIVDVNYDIFIDDKKNHTIIEKKELHQMRYFFDTELEILCQNFGFDIIEKKQWMTDDLPSFNSWNVVWVIKGFTNV